MAKKTTVKIDVKANTKGTFKKVALESKKAGEGLGNTAKNAREADRNIKGAAQASSGASKNFSKMSQGMGGLVGAYATLAANVFALTALFRFLKDAGDLRVMKEGQLEYARSTGESMALLTSRVQEATGQMLNFQEAAQAVQIGRAAGLDSSQITALAGVAKNASLALGRDLTDSFNRLTRGAIKAEPELLDELGIIIRLDTATSDYAQTVGKTAANLTTWEKSQAVVNAVIKQGEKKFGDYNIQLNQFSRMGKEFDDLLNSIKEMIAPIAEFIAGGLTKNISALAGAFALLGVGIVRSLTPAVPAMQGVEAQIVASRTRISQLAQGGQTAQGGLGQLERSAKSKSQKVFLNKDKAEVRKHLAFVKAAEKRNLAERSTGFKKWHLERQAERLQMEAEHGKMLGRMKAMQIQTMRVMSTAMKAVGYIGMLMIVIGLIRQLMGMLKDPLFKKLEEMAEGIDSAIKTQIDNIAELTESLHGTGSAMEHVAQFSNVLSNFDYSSFMALGAMMTKIDRDVDSGYAGFNDRIQGMEIVNTTLAGSILLLEEQRDLLLDEGVSTHSVVTERIEKLKELMNTYTEAAKSKDLADAYAASTRARARLVVTDDMGAYSMAMQPSHPQYAGIMEEVNLADVALNELLNGMAEYRGELHELITGTPAAMLESQKPFTNVNIAIERTTRAYESFNETKKQFDVANTKFYALREAFIDVGEAYGDMVEGLGESSKIGDIGEDVLTRVENMLGGQAKIDVEGVVAETRATGDRDRARNLAQMQALKIQELMLAQAEKIRKIEDDIVMAAIRLKTEKFAALTGATRFQRKEITRRYDILDIEQKIAAIVAEVEARKAAMQSVSQITEDQEVERLRLLKLQRDELEEQGKLMVQLHRDLAATFEKSLSSGFADMLKGKEKSLGDMLVGMAEKMAQKMADTLAENWVSKLMNKNSPAAELASAGGTAGTTIATALTTAGNTVATVIGAAISTAIAPLVALMGGGNQNQMYNAASTTDFGASIGMDQGITGDYNATLNRLLEEADTSVLQKMTKETKVVSDGSFVGPPSSLAFVGPPSEEEKGFFARLTEGFGGIITGLGEGLSGAWSFLTGSRQQTEKMPVSMTDPGGAVGIKGGITESLIVTEEHKSRKGAFGPLIDSFDKLLSPGADWMDKLGEFFGTGGDSFLSGLGGIFSGVWDSLFGKSTSGGGSDGLLTGGGFGGFMTTLLGFVGANGGIVPGGFRKFASGGIASSPTLGLIGEGRHNEAVVPLPNGKAIPVDMKGGAQNNNITVNVSTDGKVQSEGGANGSADMARAIASAVQNELQNQKRAGGILNRYGAA